jgi:Xaa-Pro aminopeptidase
VVVRESEQGTDETPMLEFEAITLVPFDTRLLDVGLMSAAELAWLNSYHQQVAATIGPLLQGPAKDWLIEATRALV